MRTKCIFIIEDNKVFRKITRSFLELNLNARIVTFQSAEEAISELDVYRPEVIVLDYSLNSKNSDNMSGLEFLKKSKGKSNAATIIISGQRNKHVASNLLKAGAVHYIEKDQEPFFEILIMEIKHQLKLIDQRKESVFQRLALRKRLFRATLMIALPILVAIVISVLA